MKPFSWKEAGLKKGTKLWLLTSKLFLLRGKLHSSQNDAIFVTIIGGSDVRRSRGDCGKLGRPTRQRALKTNQRLITYAAQTFLACPGTNKQIKSVGEYLLRRRFLNFFIFFLSRFKILGCRPNFCPFLAPNRKNEIKNKNVNWPN